MKDSPGDLRPDLVVWHPDKTVSIIDVTIPYEGETDAFSRKEIKISAASDWLETRGH